MTQEFEQRLRQLGYVEGCTIYMERRSAQGRRQTPIRLAVSAKQLEATSGTPEIASSLGYKLRRHPDARCCPRIEPVVQLRRFLSRRWGIVPRSSEPYIGLRRWWGEWRHPPEQYWQWFVPAPSPLFVMDVSWRWQQGSTWRARRQHLRWLP